MAKRDPSFVDTHVGNRVRVRRQIVGMSQEKLGELLGITFQQVQKYEKGSNRISAGRLFLMARVLGVPIHYFFDGLPDSDKQGFSEDGQAKPVADVFTTPEAIQLNRLFGGIADEGMRKLALALLKTVTEHKG